MGINIRLLGVAYVVVMDSCHVPLVKAAQQQQRDDDDERLLAVESVLDKYSNLLMKTPVQEPKVTPTGQPRQQPVDPYSLFGSKVAPSDPKTKGVSHCHTPKRSTLRRRFKQHLRKSRDCKESSFESQTKEAKSEKRQKHKQKGKQKGKQKDKQKDKQKGKHKKKHKKRKQKQKGKRKHKNKSSKSKKIVAPKMIPTAQLTPTYGPTTTAMPKSPASDPTIAAPGPTRAPTVTKAPTPAAVPTISTPTAPPIIVPSTPQSGLPTLAPQSGFSPSTAPSTKVPMGSLAPSTRVVTSTSPTAAPPTSVVVSPSPTTAPSTRVVTSASPTNAPSTRLATKPPLLPTNAPVAMAPTSNVVVSATRLNIDYQLGSKGPVTNEQFDVAQNLTLQYLRSFKDKQIGLSAGTTLVDAIGMVVRQDNNKPQATYDVKLVFSQNSTVIPTQAEVDALALAAFNQPLVKDLIASLDALPSNNPFSTTSAVTYTPVLHRLLRKI